MDSAINGPFITGNKTAVVSVDFTFLPVYVEVLILKIYKGYTKINA